MSDPTDWGELKTLLDEKSETYNRPGFIPDDPVSVPHRFSKLQDVEIAGFLSAALAWGQRKTIIKKANAILDAMRPSPHEFILGHNPEDLKIFLGFRHRTFNDTDLLYFFSFLRKHYQAFPSLEDAFTRGMKKGDDDTANALNGFYGYFFSPEGAPTRTRKHIPCPRKGSACKRLNMFLRWMVRSDGCGVDFGVWKNIRPSQLVCPFDVHVEKAARTLHLVSPGVKGWKAAAELTRNLKRLDPFDPVKYDFALFGLGLEERKMKAVF